jgi:hypothetical protein
VLDDMEKGCSVHKLDIDAAGADDDDDNVVGRLPGPPVFRTQYPTFGDYDNHPYVAVLGSNIIGIGTGSEETFIRRDAITVAFDLKTAALTILHGVPADMRDCNFNLAVAAGNKLWLFQGEGRGMHCKDESLYSKPRWRWSDHAVPDMDGICARALYHLTDGIFAHALHPGGRAFFVSSLYVYNHADGHRAWATVTFSYDTERGEWTHHGDWQLPFQGQAHYDRDMAAWIGLHFHFERGRYNALDTDGYLCCCDVPPPPWKLVPMGGGGNFCLVEILTREGVDRKGCLGDGDKCLLRLTTFRVKYGDDDGELTITARRPAGEYKLSKYDMSEAQAFWM